MIPLIRFSHEIEDEPVGGKARGLKSLLEIGLRVPDAFVIIHPEAESLNDGRIHECLEILGPGPKAVRSSAVSEDGKNASFAGQFETFLNLQTYEEVRDSIIKCIRAADADRVQAYSGNLLSDADLRISVIVQNMVQAVIAGVVFSVNPVNNRHDKILINAIAGHGEELVSGRKDCQQYEIFRSGSNLSKEVERNGHLLTESQAREILEGTLKAERHLKTPVDLEWAIDQSGVLHWLQVRPVTTIDSVHLNELDTVKGPSSDTWTLGNIGEMMPGVATPLTYSISAEAIDYGMMVLADKTGASSMKRRKGYRYIQMFYNRLFINMSHMMDYPKNIWMNKSEDVQFALSTNVPYELDTTYESPLPRRVWNFFRQIRIVMRAGYHLKKLTRLDTSFSIPLQGDMYEIYFRLDHSRWALREAFGHHIITSGQSGTFYSAFIRILTGDKRKPEARDHHIATQLLLNIPEIESADAVKTLEKFALLIRNDREFASRFTGATPEVAYGMLVKQSPQPIRDAFSFFLKRHGHRCVRESELREKTWSENPVRLIQILQHTVKAEKLQHTVFDAAKQITKALEGTSFTKKMILRMLIPISRRAVARREISKALSIHILSRFRQGYRKLAEILVNEGLLDDHDQIYFLLHEEIRQLISQRDPEWKSKASKRRQLLKEADSLEFEEVCRGIPEPVENGTGIIAGDGQLTGIPVSSGIIRGKARIVHTLEEADHLKEGEIMVASFTDIGWTPYFSIISGLITEIGSPLSHGAVVAREYGIPAVVGVKGARTKLKDGEEIILDADKGIIEKLTQ